jgi:hypothetical protein
MKLEIINGRPKYQPVRLTEPPSLGYLHVGAQVEPPSGRIPVVRASARKTALLDRLRPLIRQIRDEPAVLRATLYRAVLMPPPFGYANRPQVKPVRYDIVALIETDSPDSTGQVRKSEPYQALLEALAAAAREVGEVTARCAKSLGDVDKQHPGLFLFNYFVAEDADIALELWDWLAAWFQTETGLDDSTVLQPTEPADFAFVNHARWNITLPQLALRLAKPSFRGFVADNLLTNRTGTMPIFYRLA